MDFLTKKKKINEGEVQQYYVENAHPAIIEPAVFEMVGQEMQRRRSGENRHSGAGIFASRLKCGKCGSWYGSKVWHSTSKYRRTIYQCNHKFNGEKKCDTPHLSEEEIKSSFVSAANIFLADKKEIIADFNAIKTKLFNVASLEKERAGLQDEVVVVSELLQKCIEENARVALDQSEYESRYTAIAERYNAVNNQLAEVTAKITDKKTRRGLVERFLADLAAQDGFLTEFDESLWTALVDFATVGKDGKVVFTFKNGMEVTV